MLPKTVALTRSFIRDDVYQLLRRWIVEGELRPGEQLRDKVLAAHLCISRTPVREALLRLETEGLVESSPNRWTRVALVSRKDAESVFPIMQKLERLALSQALPLLSDSQIDAMRQFNEQLCVALEDNDLVWAANIDTEFHQVWIDAAENAELSGILTKLRAKYYRIDPAYSVSPEMGRVIVEEHNRLLIALEERNLQQASAALSSRWHASIEWSGTVDLLAAESTPHCQA